MRVRVDPVKCQTIGTCVREAPSIFRFEPGSKKAVAIVDMVPSHLEQKVRKVAGMCPTGAIEILE